MRHTPLEIFAKTILHLANNGPKAGQDRLLSEAQKTLEAYDEFLGILADRDRRERLERLPSNEMNTDTVFSDARKISHRFRDGITSVFFDEPSGLGNLTRIYGVF
jgi:hypothetical protein